MDNFQHNYSVLEFLYISLIHLLFQPSKPTEPVECTDENEGNCECADTSKGFQTYTFWLGNQQRCFTVYRSLDRVGEILPVVLFSNCYAKDRLRGIDGKNPYSKGNKAAARFGYARIGISTPDGNWQFGNDGIVNNAKPMPCSNEDSKDIQYVRKIIEFLEANSDKYDTSKMYAQGFSQNSMFSAYIAFCYNHRVRGVWQGGSGMALNGKLEQNSTL